MFPLRVPLPLFLSLFTLASCVSHSYFVVKEPQGNGQWYNDAVNILTWEKGVWDGITEFDIEMTRLSEDGVTYIAYNVQAYPSSASSLNIYLQDVPTGDDYYIVLMNSTHGVRHCLSAMFSIVNASTDVTSSSSVSASSTDTSIPTVTVSGSPDPTKGFVTTFASRASSVVWAVARAQVCGGVAVVVGVLVGALLVL
ncbi:uncharacterized protein BT62DRAFT_952684 [Guyanagaster necrorhizus]|uniref:Uncharacterized protein n=1 Tax=Guyanagaster necrorhizus TaxID=856835 RepID=A0A9P7VP47_9AGAR|nr:uncharacterized protein BT62DRAFT_952684 [Guyanagaster necrorhizus MCA 3950]KAG7444212.1 hypothetical protein BT62DRAFT_952684 [Guyanagaster necrorhizus MCA 3950]